MILKCINNIYLYICVYHIFKSNSILFISYVALVGTYVALSYLNDTDGIHIYIYDILCTVKYIILTFTTIIVMLRCNWRLDRNFLICWLQKWYRVDIFYVLAIYLPTVFCNLLFSESQGPVVGGATGWPCSCRMTLPRDILNYIANIQNKLFF